MTQARSGKRIWTLIVAAGAVAGCKAVVQDGGKSDGGGSGGSVGGPDANRPDVAMDMREQMDLINTVDLNGDGMCAGVSMSAMVVPLDLYVMMDSSLSMNDTTGAGSKKWDAVSGALTTFFKDSNSAGLGVGLKYFPAEQSGVPASCAIDADCGASGGMCDHRTACVTNNTRNTGTPVFCASATDCTGTNKVCAQLQDCGGGNYCVAAGTGMCQAPCAPFAGYCRSRDICDRMNYAMPVLPIMTLPGAEPALTASLSAHSPDGFTPTGPALQGAHDYAKGRLTTNPDHKTAVVLVTDGLPGGFVPGMPNPACAPSDIPGVAAIAAGGLPAVPTFVIGIFGPADLVDPATAPQKNLDMIAAAGGTGKAVIVDTSMDVTSQIQNALKQVQTSSIACQYTIPPAPTGMTFNSHLVNVDVGSGSSATTMLGFVADENACAAHGGWHYDIDPMKTTTTPKQIIICNDDCTKLQADSNAHVDIALGCDSYIIP